MDDEEFLRQFESCELPHSEWTHRAHVRIAYLCLLDTDFDTARLRVSEGIRRFKAAKNVPEGPLEGYNETTTHAFLKIVHATMLAYAKVFPVKNSEAFCDRHTQLLDRNILRLFYSPERRTHPEAKTNLVPPDLAPLPEFPPADPLV